MCYNSNMSSMNRFRHLVCAMMALLMFCSVLFLPECAVYAYAAEKTVTIASPVDYFGEIADMDSGETYTAYYFHGYRTFPESRIDDYIDALKDQGIVVSSTYRGGYLINLKYDGEECLQIGWDTSDNRDGGYIRVNVQKPLIISDSGKTTSTTPTTSPAKPSTSTTTTIGGNGIGKLAIALERIKGILKLKSPTETTPAVKFVFPFDSLTIPDSDDGKQDSKTSVETAPVEKPDVSSNTKIKDGQLPDPGLFLNCSRHEDMDSENVRLVSYQFAMKDGGLEVVEDVVSLFERPEYNLKLIELKEHDCTDVLPARRFYDYIFDYTGTKTVETHLTYFDEIECEVSISVVFDYSARLVLLAVRFGNELELVDSGEKTTYQLIDYSGASSKVIADGPDDGSRHTVQCGICNGTGDCGTCGGDGYLYSSASGEENRNCHSCHTNKGGCFSCGGDGWLN